MGSHIRRCLNRAFLLLNETPQSVQLGMVLCQTILLGLPIPSLGPYVGWTRGYVDPLFYIFFKALSSLAAHMSHRGRHGFPGTSTRVSGKGKPTLLKWSIAKLTVSRICRGKTA